MLGLIISSYGIICICSILSLIFAFEDNDEWILLVSTISIVISFVGFIVSILLGSGTIVILD